MGLIASALGTIALIADRKSITNFSFFLFTNSTAVWLICNNFSNIVTDHDQSLIWNKLIFASSSIIFGSLLLFALNYPRKYLKQSNKVVLLIALLTGIVIILSLTNQIVQDVVIHDGYSDITFGDLSFVYFVLAILSLLMTAWVLIKKYRNSKAIERQKLKYIMYGLSVAITGGVMFNLVLPVIFNNFSFSNVGPLFLIVFFIFILIGIREHQLLDIRFLFGKFVYYTLLAGLLFVAFYFFNFFYATLFGSVYAPESLILSIPISYGFMLSYLAVTQFIKKYTDSRLINPGYDPLEVVDDLNRLLSTNVEETKIAENILETIARTIRPETHGLIVIDTTKGKLWRDYTFKEKQPLHAADFSLAANIWDETDYRPLVIDDFDYELLNRFLNVPHLIQELEKLMLSHSIKVIYPLGDKEKISGMLLLGKKDADSPYSLQDMKFLDSLARSASVAINRSMLYQEIQDFNVELQKQVEDATGELKTKNKTLEETLSNLEEIRRQERDMIDVMGHELRTPISIVRNALLVLNSKFKGSNGQIETETLGKYLDMAVESVRREITLIETLLSATKVEGNRIQLQFTKVDLLDVVNDSIEALKRDADLKNLPIKFEAKDAIYVFADRVRCQEIIDNFLSNAIKYTPKGEILITLTADDKYGTVKVKDSGVGISAADIAKLGKKFFRAQPHYSAEQGSRPSGTGLGLYVTFELIHVMFGERIVESELGKGSTFGFSLPLFTGQEDKGIDQTFMTDPKLAKNAIDTGVKS